MQGTAERSAVVRTDIQALRALAVVAVVIFHLWPSVVPGGYVGVDVFFVISGFLITGQLYAELEATGRIGLLSFYARRIRRLLPSAFVVLSCTLVLLVLLVPRVVWRENLRQMRAASAYVINWQLAADRTDYLAANSSPTLVQHYWSLALEEQFYLLWPLLLLLMFAWGARLHIASRIVLATMLAVTAVVSFVYAVQTTASSPALGFFATQSRVWEFALGGLIALAPAIRWRARLGAIATWTGVCLVIASCLLLGDGTSFPGWATLLPTAGCALAIAGGSAASGPATSVVTWVGDHSYALYLWHWPPIIVLPWVLHEPLDDRAKLGIVVATLVLAWLTKRYVDDPVRSGPAWRARRWASVGLATAGAAALVLATTVVRAEYDRANDQVADMVLAEFHGRTSCFGAAAMVENGCRGRFALPAQSVVDFAPADLPPVRARCQTSATATPEPAYCWFGDLTSPRSTIAVVGNSHAVRLVPVLLEWAKGRHVRILLASRTDCLGLSTMPVPGQRPDDPCLVWSGHVQARLMAIRNLSLVVFTGHEMSLTFLTGQEEPGADAVAGARRNALTSLRLFSSAGIPTLVVKHPPGTRPWPAPECVARSEASDDPCAMPRGRVTRMDFLSGLAAAHPGITAFLSLDRYFCDAHQCHAAIGGVVAYSDALHISATYARTLAPYVGPAISKAMRVRQAHPRPGS